MKRSFLSPLILLIFAVGPGCLDASPPNVLFIAIDDLRPALGCYGDKTAITPNIDRLARRGTVFNRAYCQQAVCAPSRLSLMTGRRPDTTRVWDLGTHFRKALPEVVTLPQHFKRQGYESRSIGKIYHGNGKASKDPPSWSVKPLFDANLDPGLRYAAPENLARKGLKRGAAEAADVPDETYIDGLICQEALKALDGYAGTDQPFFLAVGFKKPHLPFCAPKRYWDLYDRARIPGPVSADHPEGAPELAVRSWRELEGYADIPKDGKLSRGVVRELRHGYYACVSYIDAQVGRLLDRLKATGLEEKTIVCLWGDHGFHLGEQGLWTKANNYEWSTRVPLVIADPAQSSAGTRTEALVELVDLYPTLAELCGLKLPRGLEGISLKPLLENPDRQWKTAAFSQYPRPRKGNRHRGHGDIMGYAIRTVRYRYVEWREWHSRMVVGRELYDHQLDPNEMNNIIDHPEMETTALQHSNTLSAGWKAARPVF
ncbi:MAG: sulfatase [Verrucomicrobiota bacterium]